MKQNACIIIIITIMIIIIMMHVIMIITTDVLLLFAFLYFFRCRYMNRLSGTLTVTPSISFMVVIYLLMVRW